MEIQSVGRDVTERVAAEARFLAAAETLPDGLAIFDADDRLVYHNSRYPGASGAAISAPPWRWASASRTGCATAWRWGRSITPTWARASSRDASPCVAADQSDHEQHLADGRWVRIREARMPDGGRVLLSSDITRQRSLEAELRQAEKLKAVGTLASGIAHDFNNILATIFTSTEVALLHLRGECAGTRGARPGHERRQARAAAGRRDPDLQPQRADLAGRDRARRGRRRRTRSVPARTRRPG